MTPRVYVACLASYNNGVLHGAWVDAIDADEVREGIAEVLRTSPVPGAEEHAFHDYDGFPSGMGEYESAEKVAAIGELLYEHGTAARIWLEDEHDAYETHGDARALGEAFEEAYAGEWESFRAYCEDYAESCLDRDGLAEYFFRGGIDALVRDLDLEHTYEHENGRCHVFRRY